MSQSGAEQPRAGVIIEVLRDEVALGWTAFHIASQYADAITSGQVPHTLLYTGSYALANREMVMSLARLMETGRGATSIPYLLTYSEQNPTDYPLDDLKT